MSDEQRTEAESNQFIGWYEGFHGRDAEIAKLYERINQLEDALSDVLSYLEGDPQYANAKDALIVELTELIRRDRFPPQPQSPSNDDPI